MFYCFFILFADDSNLFISHKNLNALIVQMNRELEDKVLAWLKVNKLSLYWILPKHTLSF